MSGNGQNSGGKRQLFGTDGIRGTANSDIMSAEMALRVGQAVGILFRRTPHKHRILIGKDTRLSGYMIETAIASGLVSTGVDVLLVGPLPTPGIAFLTGSMRADAGIVISASHNPYTDNGIKLFGQQGFKLPDDIEAEIERLILEGPEGLRQQLSPPERIGKAFRIDDAVGRYTVYLKSTFPRGMTLEGLKIVIDCANGATYRVAPDVMDELGGDITTIGDKPNGTNINRGVGSTHPEAVAHQVGQHDADIGIAFDGDGDRVIFVDAAGNIVDGDAIMALCGTAMIGDGRLRHNTVVGTIMSNLGLEMALRRRNGRLVRAAVGDRYVMEAMLQGDYNFGGEQSGHMIFLDHTTTGDGILTALQVLALMQRTGKPLAELAGIMERVPQHTLNLPVKSKTPIEDIPSVMRAIRAAESEMGQDGRVVVRYSGTEPKVRIMVEGVNDDKIRHYCDAIAEEFRNAADAA